MRLAPRDLPGVRSCDTVSLDMENGRRVIDVCTLGIRAGERVQIDLADLLVELGLDEAAAEVETANAGGNQTAVAT